MLTGPSFRAASSDAITASPETDRWTVLTPIEEANCALHGTGDIEYWTDSSPFDGSTWDTGNMLQPIGHVDVGASLEVSRTFCKLIWRELPCKPHTPCSSWPTRDGPNAHCVDQISCSSSGDDSWLTWFPTILVVWTHLPGIRQKCHHESRQKGPVRPGCFRNSNWYLVSPYLVLDR